MENDDTGRLKEIQTFFHFCTNRWTSNIASNALRLLSEGNRNKIKLLPLADDVQLLTRYLASHAETACNVLEQDTGNIEAWSSLRDMTLASLVLFNCRRHGEVSKMTLDDFAKIMPGEADGVITQLVSPFEKKKLLKKYHYMELVGKRG